MAGKMKVVNVFPLNEKEKHEKTEECKCKPQVEPIGAAGKVIVHNLIEGRKHFDITVDDNRWAKPKLVTLSK